MTYYYDAAGRLIAEVNYAATSVSAPGPYDAVPSNSEYVLVTSYSYVADTVQTLTITGSPTGGSFHLIFGGDTTSAIAYNASASTVESDLAALGSIGSGNVSVIGNAGGPYTIRFIGSLTGEYQSPITTSSSLTGGTSPSIGDVVAIPGGNAGMQQFSTDPRGIVTASDFDMLGDTLDTIDAFTDGVPTDDTNQMTAYTYDGNGDVLTQTAVMPAGQNSQTTAYVYSVGGTIGTNLFSNDLIAKTEYPDPTTGAASTSAANDVSQTYDNLGETLTKTDQNGNTHTYTYDSLGRLTLDAVTTLGSGVDGSVRALGYAYTALGLPYQQTSYSSASTFTSGTTVNQDQDAYNGLEQLTAEYQNVSGMVNTSTTPKVQYAYSSLSTGSLPTEMIYPNGRILHFGYNNNALDTAIGRIDYLADDNGSGGVGSHLVDYTYQGLDTFVGQDYGNGVDETTTLNAFGDIAEMNYAKSGASTDDFQYGYDRDGNVLYMDNMLSSSFSELYHANSTTSGDDNTAYDPLGRLTNFIRGTLSSSGNNGSTLDTVATANSLAGSSQSWSLDAIGNQLSVTTDGTATDNTQNSQNELTGVGSSTLTYDNDGNMTTDQNGNTLTYDAWNRLVSDSAGTTSYTYDANGRRVSETQSGTTTDFYLSTQDQVLEERQSGTVTAQNAWSIDYVNDLVLRDDNSTSGGLGISGSGLGNRIYYQHDANFNITATTNSSGVVQQRFIYSPYGVQTVLTSSWGTSSTSNSVYGFQGGRYDAATGLNHFDNRDYSPSLAVWVQKDPAGYINGSNRYQMVASDPIALADPLGLADSVPVPGLTLPDNNQLPPPNDISVPPEAVGAGAGTGGNEPFYLPTWEPSPIPASPVDGDISGPGVVGLNPPSQADFAQAQDDGAQAAWNAKHPFLSDYSGNANELNKTTSSSEGPSPYAMHKGPDETPQPGEPKFNSAKAVENDVKTICSIAGGSKNNGSASGSGSGSGNGPGSGPKIQVWPPNNQKYLNPSTPYLYFNPSNFELYLNANLGSWNGTVGFNLANQQAEIHATQ